MKRLKENAMLIILCIVIIGCALSINIKIDKSVGYAAEQINKVEKELLYKPDKGVVESLKWTLDSIDDRLHNIDSQLDGSLDDIIYYMPKARQ